VREYAKSAGVLARGQSPSVPRQAVEPRCGVGRATIGLDQPKPGRSLDPTPAIDRGRSLPGHEYALLGNTMGRPTRGQTAVVWPIVGDAIARG
jgi:hypothetical protein